MGTLGPPWRESPGKGQHVANARASNQSSNPQDPSLGKKPQPDPWWDVLASPQAALISRAGPVPAPAQSLGPGLGEHGSKAEKISITESLEEGRPGLIHSPLPAVPSSAQGVGGRVNIHPPPSQGFTTLLRPSSYRRQSRGNDLGGTCSKKQMHCAHILEPLA